MVSVMIADKYLIYSTYVLLFAWIPAMVCFKKFKEAEDEKTRNNMRSLFFAALYMLIFLIAGDMALYAGAMWRESLGEIQAALISGLGMIMLFCSATQLVRIIRYLFTKKI